MEEWLSGYRFNIRYNLAESGMRDLTLKQLLKFCGETSACLENLLMEDMPTNGSLYLREAIANCYENLDPKRILVTTGTGEALFVFFNNVLSRDDEVVVSFPAFQALYEVPRSIGAKLRFYHHKIEENYIFNAERFASLINNKTKLVIINTPHNPTGAVCEQDAIKYIVERARKFGAKVLFDEHYRFLPHDEREILPSGIELGDDLFATGSITKCFGAMGLRVGWLIGSPEMLARCRDMRDYLTHTLSPISEKLTELALKNRKRIINENLSILKSNKQFLARHMENLNQYFEYVEPKGGLVCFPRYKFEIESRKLAGLLIEKAEVFCLPAHSFEMENHLRIGLGSRPEMFEKAITAISKALPEIAD